MLPLLVPPPLRLYSALFWIGSTIVICFPTNAQAFQPHHNHFQLPHGRHRHIQTNRAIEDSVYLRRNRHSSEGIRLILTHSSSIPIPTVSRTLSLSLSSSLNQENQNDDIDNATTNCGRNTTSALLPQNSTWNNDSSNKEERKTSMPKQTSLTTNADNQTIDGETSTHHSSHLPALKFRWAVNELIVSVVLGAVTGFSVAIFKLSIETMRRGSYSLPFLANTPQLTALVPAVGGLLVGLLFLAFGANLPPGLRGTVEIVEIESRERFVLPLQQRLRKLLSAWKKSVGAVFTLGTGCSLGPEGPCVEIGMSVARSCMNSDRKYKTEAKITEWNRILLSCGAAAGVAAGFDAPVAGVFFAIEVMQSAFNDYGEESRRKGIFTILRSDGLFTQTSTITPVLLSSVMSALAARSLLGQHLVFQLSNFSLPNPLLELPMYLLLGFISGCVAFLFSQSAKLSKSFFTGELGSRNVRSIMIGLPPIYKPALGGLFCGVVAQAFPQILFFGYDTLNTIMANKVLPTSLLLSLLLAKGVSTAISTGSGLIGGTFAPALFLGAITGSCYHNVLISLCEGATILLESFGLLNGGPGSAIILLADMPTYAIVGAASVLAALFRAPLTASLLLFELSRSYDVILPIIASAGIGSVVGDILDSKFDEANSQRRDQDAASWGGLSTQTLDRTMNGEGDMS